MHLNHYLAQRLQEVLLNGTWVAGTNFKAEIIGLHWQTATTSVHGFNSIAALTFHIHYYLKGVNEVFKGGDLTIKDANSFKMPAIKNQTEWDALVEAFCKGAERFINLVLKMENTQLMSSFVDEKYGSYMRNIDVMIEHTYYHLGQILLIKKALATP